MSKELKTIQVTKSDLAVALQNNQYWSLGKDIPFTKSKAKWLLDNPRMEKDDVCAIIGYEGDDVVAFVYLVPDLMQTQGGDQKVFWCRRWWVAPSYKNSVLATYIMNEAVTVAGNNVLIKFLGKEVIDFYKKQPYVEFANRVRYFIVFNLDANLITSKVTALKTFKPIFKVTENISGKLISFFNNRKAKRNTSRLTYEYLAAIDNYTWEFLEPKLSNDLTPKTVEFVNWQISNDQYTITTVANKFPYKDLIAGSSFQIFHVNFNIILEQQIIGFVSVLVRANEFNVKYFITEDQHFDLCVDALIENFIKTKTNTIHTENQKLGEKLLERYKSVYADKRTLYGLVHKDIAANITDFGMEDQDGHFA